jgi:hypothetical protein
VVQGDAVEYDPGPADVILVDGGVTHAQPQWLDRLLPGGRLSLALTAVRPPTRMSRLLRNDVGRLLVVTREGAGFSARFGEGLGISPLYGAKDPERPATIDARAGTVYGDVVPVLDVAISAGFEEITFMGAPPEKAE